jgi:hypothetical protein
MKRISPLREATFFSLCTQNPFTVKTAQIYEYLFPEIFLNTFSLSKIELNFAPEDLSVPTDQHRGTTVLVGVQLRRGPINDRSFLVGEATEYYIL